MFWISYNISVIFLGIKTREIKIVDEEKLPGKFAVGLFVSYIVSQKDLAATLILVILWIVHRF